MHVLDIPEGINIFKYVKFQIVLDNNLFTTFSTAYP